MGLQGGDEMGWILWAKGGIAGGGGVGLSPCRTLSIMGAWAQNWPFADLFAQGHVGAGSSLSLRAAPRSAMQDDVEYTKQTGPSQSHIWPSIGYFKMLENPSGPAKKSRKLLTFAGR